MLRLGGSAAWALHSSETAGLAPWSGRAAGHILCCLVSLVGSPITSDLVRFQAALRSRAVPLMYYAIAQGLPAVHRSHSWLDELQAVLSDWMVPPTGFWVQAAADPVSQLDWRLGRCCVIWP